MNVRSERGGVSMLKMNVKIVLSSVLVLSSMFEIPGTNAKQKSLKIIIPSKIRYVHHHHTHVVLMKDKKAHKEKSPDAKFHHLHYYEDGTGGGRKNKGVNHHYYIPYLPPPAEDEAEDESVAKYTVAPPKSRIFRKPNFISQRPLPPVYDERQYPTHLRKYRFNDRDSEGAYTTPKAVIEYYEADPYFPVMMNPVQEPTKGGNSKLPQLEYRYKEEFIPQYTEEPEFEGGQLFYPEKTYYGSSQNFQHIF